MIKKMFFLSLLLIFSNNLLAQATFTISSDGNNVKKNGENFFIIGMNVGYWPQTSCTNTKYPTEDEFTSAKEIFTGLNITWIDTDTEYDYVNVSGSDCIIIGGHGYIPWILRSRPELRSDVNWFNIYPNRLSAADQIDLNPKITNIVKNQPGHLANPNNVMNIIRNNFVGNSRGDFVHFLIDEPGHGGDSWCFSNQVLEQYYDARIGGSSNLTYLDLGPMHGSELIYSYLNQEIINDYRIPEIPKYNTGVYRASMNVTGQDEPYKANVIYTADTYRNCCDVMGINSYGVTTRTPSLLGKAVTWIHNEVNKPVWVWLSADQDGHYKDSQGNFLELSVARKIMRQQIYSALANKTSGILFWTERDATHQFWDMTLDVAKELQMFRTVFEEGNIIENISLSNSSGIEYEYIEYQWNGKYIVFAVNHSDNNINISSSHIQNISLGENECSIWGSDYNGKVKLTLPRNLGFETGVDYNANFQALYDDWWFDQISGANIYQSAGSKKTGKYGFVIKDVTSQENCAAEQWIKHIPGAAYDVKAWYKHKTGSHSKIWLHYYSDTDWLAYDEKIPSLSTSEWQLVELIGRDDIPIGTTRIKISITSGQNVYKSEGFWDDVSLKIKKGSVASPTAKELSLQTEELLPWKFELEQNYPNPFNPTTTISYTIPNDGFVTLKVFDLLGKEIVSLVNEKQSSGTHKAEFDASQLPSGVYIYRIETNLGYNESKKMCLIK